VAEFGLKTTPLGAVRDNSMNTLKLRQLVLTAAMTLLLALPTGTYGDTLHLLDGTVLRGKILSFASDTLTFHTSFGSDIRVARDKIFAIDFTDSGLTIPAAIPAAGAAVALGGEPGQLTVTFKDRSVSSKIIVEKGKNERALLQANWIVQTLIVDGDSVFTYIDSVMEKTIYKGPERQYKNTIEFEDMLVPLQEGPHHVVLVVKNYGLDEYGEMFDGNPINIQYADEDVQVYAGRASLVHLGLDRGKLRTKTARFKRLQ